MNAIEITTLLKKNEKDLFSFFDYKQQGLWEFAPKDKWTAGQHVIHLVQSSKALCGALMLPNFILKWRFGKNIRQPRTYDEVINKYNEKLSKTTGLVFEGSSNMPESKESDMQKWFKNLSILNDKINAITLKISDKNFDEILIPHPLMGKMTLREILMWNAHHTEHHLQVLKLKYIQ
jgi:hypothetical protein